MNNALKGLWTPSAAVLCYECHGNKFPDSKQVDGEWDWGWRSYGTATWTKFTSPQPLAEGKMITICDKCKRDIQVYDSIAMEHNFVIELRRRGIAAQMAQTGGMCSAAFVPHVKYNYDEAAGEESHYWYVTYNDDGERKFCVGYYDEHEQWIENEELSGMYDNLDELVEMFATHEDVKQVIEEAK